MRSNVAKTLAGAGVLAALAGGVAAQDTVPSVTPIAPTVTPPANPPAVFTLAGEIVLRLRTPVGAQTPQQWVDVLTGRVTNLLATPGIMPSDVVVYTPKGGSPSVYALGRRMLTVDPATVRSAGGKDALSLAKVWAGRLQQTLPRANYRPPNVPEPVIPPHPSLVVTPDFTKVGGSPGLAYLHGKPVIFLYGPQLGGFTAQERADQISARLDRVAGKVAPDSPNPVQVMAGIPPVVTLLLGGTPVITVDRAQSRAAGTGSPQLLANAWAKNIRRVLNLPDPNALPKMPPMPAQSAGEKPAAKPVGAPGAS